MLAYIDVEAKLVYQAVYSGSPYLSVLYHSSITNEIRADSIQIVGREDAFAAIQDLIRDHENGPDCPAIHDFVAALRARANDPARVDRFVSQWIEGTAIPELRVTDVRVETRKDVYVVQGRIENIGTGDISVPIALLDEEGSTLATGEIQVSPKRPTPFALRATARPTRVVVDPDVLVLMLSRDAATADLEP